MLSKMTKRKHPGSLLYSNHLINKEGLKGNVVPFVRLKCINKKSSKHRIVFI